MYELLNSESLMIENVMNDKIILEIDKLIKDIDKSIIIVSDNKIDINRLKNEFDKIRINYLNDSKTNYEVLKNIKTKLENLLKNIKNYDEFVTLNKDFKTYEEDLPNSLLYGFFDFYVNEIILKIENLKTKEEFINDEFINLINYIYKISYEYMKVEFIYNNESKLYNYFVNNYHDIRYINEIIKADVERLTTSINYVFGVKELINIIENINNDIFIKKDIIKQIGICDYPNLYKSISYTQLKTYQNHFFQIYHKIRLVTDCYGVRNKEKYSKDINLTKIKKEFSELLKDYESFIKNKEFINETKNEIIEEINNYLESIKNGLYGTNVRKKLFKLMMRGKI